MSIYTIELRHIGKINTRNPQGKISQTVVIRLYPRCTIEGYTVFETGEPYQIAPIVGLTPLTIREAGQHARRSAMNGDEPLIKAMEDLDRDWIRLQDEFEIYRQNSKAMARKHLELQKQVRHGEWRRLNNGK